MKKIILLLAVTLSGQAFASSATMAAAAATDMTSKALASKELNDILRGNPELDEFQGAVTHQKDGRYIVSVDYMTKSGKICSIDIEMVRFYKRSVGFSSNSQSSKVHGILWKSDDCSTK